MAFARNEGVTNQNEQDILHYDVSLDYLLLRLQNTIPNLTMEELKKVLENFSVDGAVMLGLIKEITKSRFKLED